MTIAALTSKELATFKRLAKKAGVSITRKKTERFNVNVTDVFGALLSGASAVNGPSGNALNNVPGLGGDIESLTQMPEEILGNVKSNWMVTVGGIAIPALKKKVFGTQTLFKWKKFQVKV
jgi:hypothetical protein